MYLFASAKLYLYLGDKQLHVNFHIHYRLECCSQFLCVAHTVCPIPSCSSLAWFHHDLLAVKECICLNNLHTMLVVSFSLFNCPAWLERGYSYILQSVVESYIIWQYVCM